MITVNGDAFPWQEGITVQKIIDARRFTFRMLAVWVDDVPIPREHFGTYPVNDGARVQVLHMISGG